MSYYYIPIDSYDRINFLVNILKFFNNYDSLQ